MSQEQIAAAKRAEIERRKEEVASELETSRESLKNKITIKHEQSIIRKERFVVSGDD